MTKCSLRKSMPGSTRRGSSPTRCGAARVEFEVECTVCVPIEATRAAVIAHPGVVFASDTQLPGAWLQELLAHCGYGAGCRVFSSADLRLSKHTGRLFPAMLAALARPASALIHIGDNPVSDVERLWAHGIAARLVPSRRAPAAGFGDCDFVTRLAISHANTCPPAPAGPASVGAMLARIATPVLIGFGLFIIAEARRRGVSRLYFLARDGHLPMAVVRRLLAASGESGTLSLHYLDVSRAAMGDLAGARPYLHRTGFLTPGPRLVVDLGWRGSIQAALQEIAGGRDIFGCYLGLWTEALRPAISPGNAAGYLFSFGSPQGIEAQVREFYAVLELIFSAPHGTRSGLRGRQQGADPGQRGSAGRSVAAHRLRGAGGGLPGRAGGHPAPAARRFAGGDRGAFGGGAVGRYAYAANAGGSGCGEQHPVHPRRQWRVACARGQSPPAARSGFGAAPIIAPSEELALARGCHPCGPARLPAPHRFRDADASPAPGGNRGMSPGDLEIPGLRDDVGPGRCTRRATPPRSAPSLRHSRPGPCTSSPTHRTSWSFGETQYWAGRGMCSGTPSSSAAETMVKPASSRFRRMAQEAGILFAAVRRFERGPALPADPAFRHADRDLRRGLDRPVAAELRGADWPAWQFERHQRS